MVVVSFLPKCGEEEKGVGVRSAVGMGTLPDNIPVEIEAHFLLK